MSKAEIANREEVLALLTERARKGQTGAMIALERALRAVEREEREELDSELDRILTKVKPVQLIREYRGQPS